MESRTNGMNCSEKLTSGFDNLRKTKTACNFMIKVGEESFPVHRYILIAASDYFRAMLSHDTKERQEGVVDMKEVEPDAVKLCIEFIYNRATTVTMETVEILLPAAGILQLNALSENCVEVLEENLKAENCISVLKLARTHSLADLEEKALELFRENFEEFGNFAELEKEGLVERISNFSLRNELAWEVIINWIKLNVEERSKDILEFLKLLDWKLFPSGMLIERLWTERIFRNSELCREYLFKCLFRKGWIELYLTIGNCCIIKRIVTECNIEFITDDAKHEIDMFMRQNLHKIALEKAFLFLNDDVVLSLFEFHELFSLCDESLFWEGLIKWLKHDQKRKKTFIILLQCIRFDLMYDDYIEKNVKCEPIFQEIPGCYDMLEKISRQDCSETSDKTYIAFLYPNNKIHVLDVLSKTWRVVEITGEIIVLPDVSKQEFFSIFSFH
ncbi:kelch-like protein 12 [Styela clava]